MGLNIVVCVKHTPVIGTGLFDGQGGWKREGVPGGLNPFDEYAVEEGVQIKERVAGSTVTVLTMGPAAAEESLREAIARGADTGVHVSSPALAGSDAWATAYVLSMAIQKISKEKGPVHLVLCGKQTNDSDTGQVGASLAAWLDWPGTLFVKKVESVDEKKTVVHRMMEDGADVLEMDLPAVIGTVKEINTPRVASLKGKMNAKKAAITKWTEADLGCAADKVGAAGSPTVVVKSTVPPARGGGMKIDGATSEDKAKALVDKLREMKFI